MDKYVHLVLCLCSVLCSGCMLPTSCLGDGDRYGSSSLQHQWSNGTSTSLTVPGQRGISNSILKQMLLTLTVNRKGLGDFDRKPFNITAFNNLSKGSLDKAPGVDIRNYIVSLASVMTHNRHCHRTHGHRHHHNLNGYHTKSNNINNNNSSSNSNSNSNRTKLIPPQIRKPKNRRIAIPPLPFNILKLLIVHRWKTDLTSLLKLLEMRKSLNNPTYVTTARPESQINKPAFARLGKYGHRATRLTGNWKHGALPALEKYDTLGRASYKKLNNTYLFKYLEKIRGAIIKRSRTSHSSPKTGLTSVLLNVNTKINKTNTAPGNTINGSDVSSMNISLKNGYRHDTGSGDGTPEDGSNFLRPDDQTHLLSELYNVTSYGEVNQSDVSIIMQDNKTRMGEDTEGGVSKRRRKRFEYEDLYEWDYGGEGIDYEDEEKAEIEKFLQEWHKHGIKLVALLSVAMVIVFTCLCVCKTCFKFACGACCSNCASCFDRIRCRDPMYRRFCKYAGPFGIKLSYKDYKRLKKNYTEYAQQNFDGQIPNF